MKNFNATLRVIIAFLLACQTYNLFAESSQAQSNNASQDAKTYVIPKPQPSRIDALKDSLTNRRLTHQIQTLQANNTTFLTLYRPALTNSTQGCLLLLHSDNEHPDWPDVIAPLRNTMPEHSWCTLSVEVPDIIKRAEPVKIPSADNTTNNITLPDQETVFARVQAALEFGQSNGVGQFAFAGYGTGASYALSFLAANPNAGVALALIDIESPPNLTDYEIAQKIRQVPLPILDYYVAQSGNELFATWRKQAANQRINDSGDFIQIDALPDRVNGKNSQQLMTQRVRGFLKQNTSQINQRKSLPVTKKGLFYESPVNN